MPRNLRGRRSASRRSTGGPSYRRKPASDTPWTKKIWIYDLRTNQHFTLKSNPLKREDLDDFVRCYNPANRHARKTTERFRPFSYEEIVKRDKLSLDIFWLKDVQRVFVSAIALVTALSSFGAPAAAAFINNVPPLPGFLPYFFAASGFACCGAFAGCAFAS